MNKFLTKIATAFVGMTMAIGVGVALGANRETKEAKADNDVTDVIDNDATSSNTGSTSTSTWVSNFSVTGTSGAVYCIHTMGTSGTTNALQFNKNGFLYGTKSGGTLKSITIKGTSGKSIDVYAKTSAYTGEPSGTAVTTMDLTGNDVTYTFSDSYTFVAIHGKASSTQIVYVKVTYEAGAETPSVEFSDKTTKTVAVGGTVQNEATKTHADSLTLSYASSDNDIATVSSNGTVTGVNSGLVTITASVTKDTFTYSDTYKVLVTSDSTHPYTVAQARAALGENKGLTNAYVRGIVNSGGALLSNNTLCYYINDTGTGSANAGATGKDIYIYKGKGLNNANFTSTSDIQVGDILTIYGNLTIYSNKYELNSGNYIVSFTRDCTATYNANGGTVSPESATVNYGESVALPTPTKTGYTFTGWNDGSVNYDAGASVTLYGDKTFTAQWSINSYTVSGSIEHGSLSSTANINYNSALNISIVPDTANNYTYPASVSVTMGGNAIDVTYNSGTGSIYYEHVTGNIVVTAECQILKGYDISITVTNGTHNAPAKIYVGQAIDITVTPNDHYKLPASVSVTNADSTYSDGVIHISNPTAAVVITVAMDALANNDIETVLDGVSVVGDVPEKLEEGDSVELTFTADEGYFLPDSVTVSGTTVYNWTKSTGKLSLTGQTNKITVTITGVAKVLDHITLSVDSGSYTLGDDFIMPTVTAHYTNEATENVTASATFSGYDKFTETEGTDTQEVTISYTYGDKTKTATYHATVKPVTESDAIYRKITSINDLAEGKYLIVYEDGNSSKVLNGSASSSSITGTGGNTGTVAVSENTITPSNTVNGYTWTIANSSTSGKYTIKGDGNKLYIGRNSSTGGMSASDEWDTSFDNTISFSNNGALSIYGNYKSGNEYTMKLQYNTSGYFRYYSSSQKAITLYRYYPEVVKSLIRISAVLKDGTYYKDDDVSANDFVVTAHYNDGSEEVVTDDITVTGATLSKLGENDVTLSYGGKDVTVKVTAVNRSASLTGITWTQGNVYSIDGDTLDIASLSNFTATYSDSTSVPKAASAGTVALYSDDAGVKTWVKNIANGHEWDESEDGLYLGITYEENTVEKTAYSGRVFVAEHLESITGFEEQEKTATLTNAQVIAIKNADEHDDPIEADIDSNIHLLGGGSGTATRAWTDGIRFYKNGTFTFTPSNGAKIKEVTLYEGLSCSVAATVNGSKYIITNPTDGAITFTAANDISTTTISSDIVIKYEIVAERENIANTDAKVQKAVLDFVAIMNKDLGDACEDYGLTTGIWNSLSEKYDNAIAALSTPEEKALFANMLKYATSSTPVEDEDGYGRVTSGDTLQQGLARYDYILKRYNTSTSTVYEDFLGRVDAGSLNYNTRINSMIPNVIANSDSTTIILLIVSFLGISVITGYFLLRRRKEN